MSNAVFYRSALARELTPEVRALIQSLFSRAEQIDSRAEELPAQFLANRARREGKPPALTKSAKRTIRSFERDSRKAAEELPALVASVPTEALLRSALESERTALSLDQAVYTGGHQEDEALARPLLELKAENIAELEAFLSRSKTQSEKTGSGS
jgi:phytoene dehydrogenase-like protein